jgi:hypothetical protein
MERALKYTFVVMLVIALLFIGSAYVDYFNGARYFPHGWGPSTATYPADARRVLWQVHGGRGEPAIERQWPPIVLWRWFAQDEGFSNPSFSVAGRAARLADIRAPSQGAQHLAEVAGAIQASRWPQDRLLDSVLDREYFGNGATGLRAGAMRLYGRSPDRLTVPELQVLLMLTRWPHFHPWCRRDKLRERFVAISPEWDGDWSIREFDAALARIRPKPPDLTCPDR